MIMAPTAVFDGTKKEPQDEEERRAWEAAAAALETLNASAFLSGGSGLVPGGSPATFTRSPLSSTKASLKSGSEDDDNAEDDDDEEEEEDDEMPHLLPGQEQSLLYPSTLLKHSQDHHHQDLPDLTDETSLTSLTAQREEDLVTDLDSKLPPPPSAMGALKPEPQTSTAAALMEAYAAASHASYEKAYEQQMHQRTFASPYAYPIAETEPVVSSPPRVVEEPTVTSSGRISKKTIMPGMALTTPSRSKSPSGPYVRRLYPCPTSGCSKVHLRCGMLTGSQTNSEHPQVYKNANGLKYHLEKGTCDSLGDAQVDPEAVAPPASLTRRTSSSVPLPERPYYCRVQGCIKYYRNLSGLKYHGRTAHPELDFEFDVKGLLTGKEEGFEAMVAASSAMIEDEVFYS
jgi:hypothetical protein